MAATTNEEYLLLVARWGSLPVLDWVLNETGEVDVNWCSPDGRTALLVACDAGFPDIVGRLLSVPGIDPNLGNQEGITPLLLACGTGSQAIVAQFLRDPRVDLRLSHRNVSPLFVACQEGHADVVSLLLGHPGIDVNQDTVTGTTPLSIACSRGHQSVIGLLLADSRVDVNQCTSEAATPLYMAAQEGYIEIVRMLLAWRGDVDTRKRITTSDPEEDGKTVGEWVRALSVIPKREWMEEQAYERIQRIGPDIADLIEEFERDPETVRASAQRLPCHCEYFVAHTFALMVFFTDGFLAVGERTPPRVAMFLEMCSRLPLELQMTLCNRMFGSGKDVVRSTDSEPGFRWLARWGEQPRK